MHKLRILFLLFILPATISFSQQQLQYERWGKFGVGRLVTTISNCNILGYGSLRWPHLARFPAFEYPYNPEPSGRHINYAVGISFHVGGYSIDLGPTFDPGIANPPTEPRTESGDLCYYRFYDGRHFDSFPQLIAEREDAPAAVSDNPDSWPSAGWPATYPVTNPQLSEQFPDYPTAFSTGAAAPVPLAVNEDGWPGAGPNGKQIADQESFAVTWATNRIDDVPEGHLMVHVVQRGLSWQGDFYDDFLIWMYVVTNIGTEPITDAYMGLYADFDYPWASYQAYSSYCRVESYAYDQKNDIVYGWDGDGNVPGATMGDWTYEKAKLTDETPVEKVAMSGIVFLKTPQNDQGRDLGISTWDAFLLHVKKLVQGVGNTARNFYSINIINMDKSRTQLDPDDADGDGMDDWTWEHPYPVGNEKLYEGGYKAAITVNTGPFTLQPGESDTLICATVMGQNRRDLFKNAEFARQLYASDWKPLKPPLPPRVQTEVSSGRVVLSWDRSTEDDQANLATDRELFEGYKIYRSQDGGQSWGELEITDENGTVVDYIPLAQYDLKNGITGAAKQLPWFNRGNDTGLNAIIETAENRRCRYVDETVIDGFTYKYAVVAYSAGSDIVPPLQNSKSTGPNVVSVVPHADVAQTPADLEEIRVVPNPYYVVSAWEMSPNERMIKFTHLPPVCTISIYNSAGELVATLHHNHNSSIESEEIWNLRSFEDRDIAPGLYFYHCKSDIGEKTGKFVIIK